MLNGMDAGDCKALELAIHPPGGVTLNTRSLEGFLEVVSVLACTARE
jgi:hypothetical protein